MSADFWIEEKKKDQPVAVLKVGGRVEAKAAKELRTLCAELKRQGFMHIVVDMSEVSFIASSGIGAVIVLAGEMNIAGGTARLVAVSQSVARAIDMLNLTQFLTIEPNEATAMDNVNALVR